MGNKDNKRRENRLSEQSTVFVEVCSAEDDHVPANVIICNSLDMSPSGIQIEMDQAVPVGSVLRICAEILDSDQALYLVGEVKWIKPCDDQFSIGFELYDAQNTDIDGWKRVINSLLAAPKLPQ